MSNAYKCDRCGLYVDCDSLSVREANGIRLVDGPYLDFNASIQDLCPACKDDLKLFMEGFDIHPLRKIDVLTRTPKAEHPTGIGVLDKPFNVKKEKKKCCR